MTDRELLEMAAKAAGITIKPVEIKNVEFAGDDRFIGYSTDPHEWLRGWFNPLTDDGDALRLAVELHLDIRFYWDGCDDQYNTVEAYTHGAKKDAEEPIGFYLRGGQIDEAAATRRAIVRAAAAIGSAM